MPTLKPVWLLHACLSACRALKSLVARDRVHPVQSDAVVLPQRGRFFWSFQLLSTNIPPGAYKLYNGISARDSTVAAPASPSETGKSYTIKTGDTLGAIAHDRGVTIEDLQSWNHIPNPNRIFAGDTLIVREGTRKIPGALFAYKSNPYQCME